MTTAQWKEEEQFLLSRFTLAKTIAGTQRLHASKFHLLLRVCGYSNSTSSMVVSAVKKSVQDLDLEQFKVMLLLSITKNGGLPM